MAPPHNTHAAQGSRCLEGAERLSPSRYPWVLVTNACGHFFPWPPKSCCHLPVPSQPFKLMGLWCRSLISQKFSLNPQTRITHHQSQGTVRGQSPEGPCRPTNKCTLPPNAKAAPLTLYPQDVYFLGLNLVSNSLIPQPQMLMTAIPIVH